MIRTSFLLLAGVLAVTACATPPRFEYGAYEPTLYAYYKKPEMADRFEQALEKAIEKGEASDRLAPGLLAELGYLQLLQGDQAAAIALFEKEAEAFPESGFFMNAVVSRLKGGDAAVATAPEVPAAAASDEAALPEAGGARTPEVTVGGGA